MAVRFSADGQNYSRTLALGSQTQLSVTGWVKITTDRNASSTMWSIANGTSDSYICQTASDGTTMSVWGETGTQLWSTAMTVGTWYFVGFSANGVNWTAVRRAATTPTFTVSTGSNGNANTGCQTMLFGESEFNGDWLNGCVQSMKVWIGATLTQAQLQQESWSTRPKANTANLQGWYPLWRTDTADFSGKGNTLSGGTGASTEDGPPLEGGVWLPIAVLPAVTSTPATVTPDVISGTTAIPAPSLTVQTVVSPALITGATSVFAPSLVVQTVVSPDLITGTTDVPTPGISTGFDASVSPALITATTAIPSPALLTDTTVTPFVIHVSTTIPAATPVVETVVSPALISATTAVPAPTLVVQTVVSPALISATTAVHTPTLVVQTVVSPALLSATTAVPAPVMHTGSTVTPARINAAVAIPTPSLTAANEDPQAVGFYVDWEANGGFVDSPTNNLTTRLLRRSDISVRYGRDQARVLSPAAPGDLGGVLIDNHSRDYSPENTGSPLFPNVKPARELRLAYAYPNGTSNIFTLFQGFIDDFKVNPGPGERSVSLTGTDVLAKLAGTKVTTELYQSITTGDAINVVLDEIGWNPARRIIDTGSTVVRWWWLVDVDAFEAITQLVNSEGPPAIFHADADGNFVFRDRHHRAILTASNTSQATFTEGSSEPAFSEPFEYDHGWRDIINSVTLTVDEYDPTDEIQQVFLSETTHIINSGDTLSIIINADSPFITEDLSNLINLEFTGSGILVAELLGKEGSPRRTLTLEASSGDITVTRIEINARPLTVTGSVTVASSDATSITDYGLKSYPLEVPWASVEDAQAIADKIVASRKDKLPIIQLLLKGKDTEFTALRIVQQLNRDLGDKITVSEPETATDNDYWIEQIEHTLTNAHELLETKFGCERVFEIDDPDDIFILGSVTHGVLGTNRLAH